MKDYLLTQSQGLELLSFPHLKPILKLGTDQIDNAENADLNEYGTETFLKSAGSQFKLIELINYEPFLGKFKTVHEFEIPKAVCCACPKTNKLSSMAAGLVDGTTVLTHYESQNEMIVLKKNRDEDYSCSKYMNFNTDSTQFLSVSEKGSVQIFDVSLKRLLFKFKHNTDLPSLAKFKPNTETHLVGIGFISGKLKVYDEVAQKVVYSPKDRYTHIDLCKDFSFFNRKENTIISVGYDSSVLIHDFRLGSAPIMNFLNDGHLNSVVVSADDNYYCLGDDNGVLRAYDTRKSNFTPLSTVKINNGIVKKMIFLQSNVEVFKEQSSCNELADSFYDSFFIMDVPKSDERIPSCTNSTRLEDIDEVKCENQFKKNIKSRSTCIFEQPKHVNLSQEMPQDFLNTPETTLSDIKSRIDRYESQLMAMRIKIQGLVSTVEKMNEFIEAFPQFVEIEIQNLIRQYRAEDKILVEKLSKTCAADPQIVELMEYMLNRHTRDES